MAKKGNKQTPTVRKGDAMLPCHLGERSFTLLFFSLTSTISCLSVSFWLVWSAEKTQTVFCAPQKWLTGKNICSRRSGEKVSGDREGLMGRIEQMSAHHCTLISLCLSLPLTLYRLSSYFNDSLSGETVHRNFPQVVCANNVAAVQPESATTLQQHSLPDL